MNTSRIQAIRHINLEAPVGSEEDLRWFYGEVAGLEEVPGDGEDGRLCFKSEHIELQVHLSSEPRVDPIERRLTIAVASLSEAAAQLTERRVGYEYISGLLFTDNRLESRDPAGHRIVLRQGWADHTL